VVRPLVVRVDLPGPSGTVVMLLPGPSGTVVMVLRVRSGTVVMVLRVRSGTVVMVLRVRSGTVVMVLRVRSGTVVRVVRPLVVRVDPRVRTETLASQLLIDPRATTRKARATRRRDQREPRGTCLPRSPMTSLPPSSTGPHAGAFGHSARTMPTA